MIVTLCDNHISHKVFSGITFIGQWPVLFIRLPIVALMMTVDSVQYLHAGLVNPHCPRTYGPGGIHQSHLDVLCFKEFKLPELAVKPETPEEAKIGEFIAGNLVEDGATLQMGKKRFIKK